MALQALSNNGGEWSWNMPGMSGSPGFSNYTINEDADRVALIFRARRAMTISQVLFRTGSTVTDGGSLDVRIETVTVAAAVMSPSGTLWATNTAGASNPAPHVVSTVYTVTLTANATIAAGDLVAVVIQRTSGSTANMTISGLSQVPRTLRIPATMTKDGAGAWASQDSHLAFGIHNATGSVWEFIHDWILPIDTSQVATSWNSGTSVTHRGLYFRIPYKRVLGGITTRLILAASSNYVVKVADESVTDPSLMTTAATIDGDATTAYNGGEHYIPFSTTVTIEKDTWYRVVIEPTTTTSITMHEFTVANAAHMRAVPGGLDSYLTVRTSGTWAETTTRRPWMALEWLQADDAVAGSVTTVVAATTTFPAQVVKKSEATAAERRIYFTLVDATDGTAETGLTFTAGDVKLSKNGAGESNHTGSFSSHIGGGLYYYELAAAEVDTAGVVTFRVLKTGVKAFVVPVQVVEYDPYDPIRLGLTSLPPDAIITGTVTTGFTHTTLAFKVDATLGAKATDFWKRAWVRFLTGNLTGTIRPIVGFDGSTDVVTINSADPFTEAPATGDTFVIVNR